MNKTTPKTEDVEADGNTVRFINVREGGEGEPSIVIGIGAKKR